MFLRSIKALLWAVLVACALAACGGGGGGGGSAPSGTVIVALSYATAPEGKLSTSYSYSPYYVANQEIDETFVISAGSLPPGLSINSGTGAITGTPSAMGTYNFTVRLTADKVSGEIVATGTITIRDNLVITLNYSPATVTLAQAYSYTPTYSGNKSFTPSFVASDLPPGLTINASSGMISGIPTSMGTYYTAVTLSGGSVSTTKYATIVVQPYSASSSSSSSSSSSATSAASGGTSACSSSDVPGTSGMSSGQSVDVALGYVGQTVYDKGRNVFYVTMPAHNPSNPNRIATISATTGAVTYSPVIGSSPAAIAISADCSTLYVGLDSTNEVVRMALPSMTINARVSLGSGITAEAISVSPASPDMVAVIHANRAYSPRFSGLYLYNNMVKQPLALGGGNVDQLVFNNGDGMLYAYNTQTTGYDLFRIVALDTGLVSVQSTSSDPYGDRWLNVSDGVMTINNFVYTASTLTYRSSISGSKNCRKLPGVAKIACISTTTSTGTSTINIVDADTFASVGQPSVATSEPFYRFVPGGKGQLAMLHNEGLTLYQNDLLK